MGPHPEAPVDVQKYIGSCLITQQPRSKRTRPPHPHPKEGSRCGGYAPRGYPLPNYAWTGVPLISVAPPKARCPRKEGEGLEDILPISRLAIHAQGAPLILSPKECDGKEPDYAFKGPDFFDGRLFMLVPPPGDSQPQRASPAQSDCVSTTSEDSGASENGLPRIIKPRKRRKKDRRQGESEGPIVTLKPYQPLCYRYKPEPRRRAGAYPYPPSPRCRCPYCVPPPSTLLTPPDSPVAESALLALASGRGSPHGEIHFRATDDDYCLEESSLKGPNTLVLTSTHPPQRPWIYMADQDSSNSCLFTVMCYNILCDKYATRQMYGYCPNWALDWSYRKKHILQEILHYKADIISLQEVETEQFYKFFLPELKSEGYGGIFSPKSRAKTMSEGERKHVDGCAIFYKTNKFFLMKEHLVEFNQLAMANAEGSDDMLNRVMTKDNIGLAALLQTRIGAYQGSEKSHTSQTLLVCTAHIHWDPEYSDVKLIQTMMLMHELKTFVDDILQDCSLPPHQKQDPNIIPLLLCGDFNSLPDSGVIEYLSGGRVSTSHLDFKEFVYKDCLSKLGNSTKTNEFTHPFQISRAYTDGIMPFTNYSYDFKGVIDYVFYSKLHMSILGVLGPIDSNWLEENGIQGCPHPHVPSDHFPIVVELQLNPTIPLHLPTPNGISLHR